MSCYLQFPPEIDTGDTMSHKDGKIRLPARVYNKLKQHSLSEGKKNFRLHEKKEHSTAVSTVIYSITTLLNCMYQALMPQF